MWESPKSLPERLRNIHNSIQQEIPVLENTKLNLKDRVEAPTSGASITSVVTDGAHKGGTRTNPARAKARTAKSDNTGYNQTWWEQEAYQGQKWNHPSAGKSATAGSWGKSSTASGWSSRDNQSQASWDNQSQSPWDNKSAWTGEQYKIGRNGWISAQTKSYTKMYMLAINYMVQPLPFDYYEIDNYITAATNDFYNDGWDQVNAYISVDFLESLNLRFTGKNITDEANITSGSRGLGGFIFMPPEMYLLELTYTLPQ